MTWISKFSSHANFNFDEWTCLIGWGCERNRAGKMGGWMKSGEHDW